MIRPISSGPSEPMTGPPEVSGTGDPTPEDVRDRSSALLGAVRRSVRAARLGGGFGGLDLLQHRPDVALGGRQLAGQPPERPGQAVPDRPEDDEGEDDDSAPHDPQHHEATLTARGRRDV